MNGRPFTILECLDLLPADHTGGAKQEHDALRERIAELEVVTARLGHDRELELLRAERDRLAAELKASQAREAAYHRVAMRLCHINTDFYDWWYDYFGDPHPSPGYHCSLCGEYAGGAPEDITHLPDCALLELRRLAFSPSPVAEAIGRVVEQARLLDEKASDPGCQFLVSSDFNKLHNELFTLQTLRSGRAGEERGLSRAKEQHPPPAEPAEEE